MSKFKKPERGEEKIEVGSWLTAPVMPEKKAEDRIVYIDMDKLKPNEKNLYSVEDVEKMADLIEMAGEILQSLIVKPANEEGMYEITTGERRWRGAQFLKGQGRYPEKFENKVPCIIRNPEEVPLPLSKSSKEMFSILITNQYREKTDGDTLMEIREWKKIFGELREQNVEYVSFGKNDGEENGQENETSQGIQIKGVPTRKLIAEQMGLSTGQIARFEAVESKGSDRILESLKANELSLSEAEKLIKLPEKAQDKILDNPETEGAFSQREFERQNRRHEAKVTVRKQDLLQDMEELKNYVTGTAGEEMKLTASDYKKYQKGIQQIRKILEGQH